MSGILRQDLSSFYTESGNKIELGSGFLGAYACCEKRLLFMSVRLSAVAAYVAQLYTAHYCASLTRLSVFVTLLTATYVSQQDKANAFLRAHGQWRSWVFSGRL